MQSSHTSLKLIAFMGVAVFIFLYLTSLTLRHAVQPNRSEVVSSTQLSDAFNGTAALDTLKALAAAPRSQGAEGLAQARAALCREAATVGTACRELEVPASGPADARKHLFAVLRGKKPGAIALLEDWADHRLFMQVVPPVVAHLADELPPAFFTDREAMAPSFTRAALLAACAIEDKIDIRIDRGRIVITPVKAPRAGWFDDYSESADAEAHDWTESDLAEDSEWAW